MGGEGGGHLRHDSAEILFQSSLLEAIVSSSGMGSNVLFLTLSFQHFIFRPSADHKLVLVSVTVYKMIMKLAMYPCCLLIL